MSGDTPRNTAGPTPVPPGVHGDPAEAAWSVRARLHTLAADRDGLRCLATALPLDAGLEPAPGADAALGAARRRQADLLPIPDPGSLLVAPHAVVLAPPSILLCYLGFAPQHRLFLEPRARLLAWPDLQQERDTAGGTEAVLRRHAVRHLALLQANGAQPPGRWSWDAVREALELLPLRPLRCFEAAEVDGTAPPAPPLRSRSWQLHHDVIAVGVQPFGRRAEALATSAPLRTAPSHYGLSLTSLAAAALHRELPGVAVRAAVLAAWAVEPPATLRLTTLAFVGRADLADHPRSLSIPLRERPLRVLRAEPEPATAAEAELAARTLDGLAVAGGLVDADPELEELLATAPGVVDALRAQHRQRLRFA